MRAASDPATIEDHIYCRECSLNQSPFERAQGGPESAEGSHVEKIAGELKVTPRQVAATAKLLGEGATVPFIARYRKEVTGSLDEVVIAAVRDRLAQLAELDDRRAAIVASLKERELLTDELSAAVAAAETMTALEDLYAALSPPAPHPRDHRQRSRTRAACRPDLRRTGDDRLDGRSRRVRQRREERAGRRGRPGRRARHPGRAVQ